MTETELRPIIESYINQSLANLDKENPKLDFKRDWYNLTDELKINEFIKDTSAMANTVGLDGFIVIGFDDDKKTFHDAKFSDCGLSDTSQLNGIIVRRVDRMFTLNHFDFSVNGHTLGVLHIPPSFDKPHVIRNFKYKSGKEEKHRIFVRKGTIVDVATKYDIDFMNYDKRNLVPEYRVYLSSHISKWSFSPIGNSDKIKIEAQLNLTIENTGHRPIAITEIEIMFNFLSNIDLLFKSYIDDVPGRGKLIKTSNLIILPGLINKYDKLQFISTEKHPQSQVAVLSDLRQEIQSIFAKITLNTGTEINTEVKKII